MHASACSTASVGKQTWAVSGGGEGILSTPNTGMRCSWGAASRCRSALQHYIPGRRPPEGVVLEENAVVLDKRAVALDYRAVVLGKVL